MKKVASFFDNKGKLYVDYAECERGSAQDKCSAGMRVKNPKMGGCFIGEIISSIDLNKAERMK